MTDLGLFLSKRSVNKAEISRRTGISKSRLTQLSNSNTTKLTAEELYRIALSIQVSPCELLTFVCSKITLPEI
ncbi:helix-turn-helix transcriptional regulator [Mucilaginibacter sp. KACC 22773]|uniref:helix-turn-helix domain-containing protein n=1 Tax=Mucilaginibacter sp. KACC 22773 TaxID=3025671 RepID=UPI002365F23C|nr:helix-turn-helix transcriptional regulator [Mucilaginibacter sp. KACC 22773]WDF77115.1 helix-turn-helix transcriptional regulator [Mucilaginibacter sp. KACC 22773]